MAQTFITNIDWSAVATGIGSSLIASLLFLMVLFRLRPRIKISPSIAKDKNQKTGKTVYVFKVINCSPFFKLYDVRGIVQINKLQASRNGHDLTQTKDNVKIENPSYWSVDRFNIWHLSQRFNRKRKLKSSSDYAIQFGTEFDISNLIDQEKIVRLEVIARHPLSGFSKVFFEDFEHSEHIIEGKFSSGNCFDIY